MTRKQQISHQSKERENQFIHNENHSTFFNTICNVFIQTHLSNISKTCMKGENEKFVKVYYYSVGVCKHVCVNVTATCNCR